VGRDASERFGERWCAGGALGLRPTKDLMPIALAAAGRLAKYGA
jgi:2,3-bisphosphoglycerate-independent phosphoglycerate mutase